MSELYQCPCGHEFEIRSIDDIQHCDHCGENCCEECTHECANSNHVANDQGCEHCMIYNKDMQEWFCCVDCMLEVIDPYGYYQKATNDKTDMLAAVFEITKALDEGMATNDHSKLAEAKAMLLTASQMYLCEKKEQE